MVTSKTYTYDDIAALTLRMFDAIPGEPAVVRLAAVLVSLLALIEAEQLAGNPVPPPLRGLLPELRANSRILLQLLGTVGVPVPDEAVH